MFVNIWEFLARQPTSVAPTGGTCLMCGDCCKAFGGHLHASDADLQRWWELGREDILARVGSHGWLWVDPESRRIVQDCPYLAPMATDRVGCQIQEIKPDICRDYPTLAHARRCLHGVFLRAGGFCYVCWEWGAEELLCLC